MKQQVSHDEPARFRAVTVDNMASYEVAAYRRSRRRRAMLFVTLPGLALGTAAVATAYSAGWLDGGQSTCTPQQISAPARSSFDVIVLNGNANTSGLGSRVGSTLAQRGFRVVQVANAPDDLYVKGAAQINHGKEGLGAALLVQKQVPGSTLTNDGRAGKNVQLTLGYGFRALISETLPPPPAPSEITLNVYNTTSATGLAQSVAEELRAREFKVDRVGNDPNRRWLASSPGQVWYGPASESAILRLKPYLPGFGFVREAKRSDQGIDLVIGAKYQALAPLESIPAATPWVRAAEIVAKPCSTD